MTTVVESDLSRSVVHSTKSLEFGFVFLGAEFGVSAKKNAFAKPKFTDAMDDSGDVFPFYVSDETLIEVIKGLKRFQTYLVTLAMTTYQNDIQMKLTGVTVV